MKLQEWLLRFFLLSTAFVGVISADVIFVDNPSFEDHPALPDVCQVPTGGCSFDLNTPIPGWTSTGSTGQSILGPPTNTTYFNANSDGPTSAYSNGGSIEQTVADTVVVGVTYTLQVDIGCRKDLFYPSGSSGAISCLGAAALIAGNTTVDATGPPLTRGNWTTYTATYVGTPSDAGKSITIDLFSTGVQGNFDNVHLTSSVPEPRFLVGAGAFLLAIVLFRRGRLIRMDGQ